MLVKLTKGVNFITILWQFFCTKVFFETFLDSKFGFVIFGLKNMGAKATQKMLMKLITGESVFEVCMCL